MTTESVRPTDRLLDRIRQRRHAARALRRRSTLIALGLAGMAYDRVQARIDQVDTWLEEVTARGEQAESDLAATRTDMRERLEEFVDRVQARGEAMRDEMRAKLDDVLTPRQPPHAEDIPVTAAPAEKTPETPPPA